MSRKRASANARPSRPGGSDLVDQCLERSLDRPGRAVKRISVSEREDVPLRDRPHEAARLEVRQDGGVPHSCAAKRRDRRVVESPSLEDHRRSGLSPVAPAARCPASGRRHRRRGASVTRGGPRARSRSRSRIAHSKRQQERSRRTVRRTRAATVSSRAPAEPAHGRAVDHVERGHEEDPGEAGLGDLAHEGPAEEQDRHGEEAPAAAARRVRVPPRRRSAERVRLAEAGKDAPKAPARFAQPWARISRLRSGRAPAGPRGHRELEAPQQDDGGGRHERAAAAGPGRGCGHAPGGPPARNAGPVAHERQAAAPGSAPSAREPGRAADGDERGRKSASEQPRPRRPRCRHRGERSRGVPSRAGIRRAIRQAPRSSDTRPPAAGPRRERGPSSSCIAAIRRPAPAVKPTSTTRAEAEEDARRAENAAEDAQGPGRSVRGRGRRPPFSSRPIGRGEARGPPAPPPVVSGPVTTCALLETNAARARPPRR